MSTHKQINLIAVEVRKWDLEANKIGLTSYYVMDDNEAALDFQVTILQPPDMVEEFLGKLRNETEQRYRAEHPEEEVTVLFDNETFMRQKLYNYFKRILSELNSTKRKKGQPRMIFTTHMDIYNETQDISFLPQRLQFFVVLNWARKYYDKEDYKKAIDPLRKLIRIEPGYGPAYEMLARSLKKTRKYEEAMRFYEKFAEVENSQRAWLELAKSYRKGKLFDKSEAIYKQVLAEDPANKEARIGIAQIRYALQNDEYLQILDELHKEEPEWLCEWLKEEFNFRIYTNNKTALSPNQAAKFLGYDRIFDLTQRAFKNELPSHFNPGRARLTFYKEELANWANTLNRYNCSAEEIKLYPDRIDEADVVAEEESETAKKPAKAANTKVEDILRMIRERKAQRLQEQAKAAKAEAIAAGPNSDETPAPAAKPKRGRTSKKK